VSKKDLNIMRVIPKYMAPKLKITVSLSQKVIDFIRAEVAEGNAPSVGWVVETAVREKMERKKRTKPH